jgi:hypothetical protein
MAIDRTASTFCEKVAQNDSRPVLLQEIRGLRLQSQSLILNNDNPGKNRAHYLRGLPIRLPRTTMGTFPHLKVGWILCCGCCRIAESADRVDRLIRVNPIEELVEAHVFPRIFRLHAPMTRYSGYRA